MLHQLLDTQHYQEEQCSYGRGITHFKTNAAVVHQVSDNCMPSVISAGEPHQGNDVLPCSKGRRDGHNGTKHKLWAHRRQSNIPQLLPAIPDPINGPSLIETLINPLQASDESQK